MNRKFQKCPDAILAISQEVAQITSRCIYPYPMVGVDAQTISEMYYGMEIPEEHQSEVLKNYIRIKTKDL